MTSLASNDFIDLAICLTNEQDYQGVTFTLLEVLARIPSIDHVEAFEIHGKKNVRADEIHEFTDQLVQRFPLDFTSDSEEVSIEWLSDFSQINELKVLDSTGTQFLFPIKGCPGPDRAIHIHGDLDAETLNLVNNLLKVYRNLVVLHDKKERDILTNLANRQSLDSRLIQVCEFFNHHPAVVKQSWVALLDIDHFKRVNDDFGHLYGDEVLLTFSQLMEQRFRYNDFIFRFGGEEFVVILNLVSRDDAERVFNSFREMIENYNFSTVGKITVSIGVTKIGQHEMPTELLDTADQALYYAKEHGRNQVCFYSEISNVSNDQQQVIDIELF